MSRSARAASQASSRARCPRPLLDMGPPENIVATLRVLVALEDYLGSLGPKIVDLLTDALKMEKVRDLRFRFASFLLLSAWDIYCTIW